MELQNLKKTFFRSIQFIRRKNEKSREFFFQCNSANEEKKAEIIFDSREREKKINASFLTSSLNSYLDDLPDLFSP